MKQIFFEGFVGEEITIDRIHRELTAAGNEAVQVVCNSPGGYADIALSLFDRLKQHVGFISWKVVGLCASAASYVACAADEIISTDSSIWMVHQARGGGGGGYSTAQEHRQTAATLDHYNRVLAGAYAKRSGKTLAEIEVMMSETSYFYGRELLNNGWSDKHTGSGVVNAAVRDHAIVQAQTRFSASYSNPDTQQVGRIAAALGDINERPLSKEDAAAAKVAGMTVAEYRTAQEYLKT